MYTNTLIVPFGGADCCDFGYSGPTHRIDIDLSRPVGGTSTNGTVKSTKIGSPLNVEVTVTSG